MRHYHHHHYASSHHHHYAWSHHHSANKGGVNSATASIFIGAIFIIFALIFTAGAVFAFIRGGMPIFFLFPFVPLPTIMVIVGIMAIARPSRLSKSRPSVEESEPIKNDSEESEPSYVEESTPTSTSSLSQNHVVENYRCPNCSYIYDRAKGKCPICGLPPEEK